MVPSLTSVAKKAYFAQSKIKFGNFEVFFPKKRLSFARLFTKMSPSEELGTLRYIYTAGRCVSWYVDRYEGRYIARYVGRYI